MSGDGEGPLIYVVAGEASGDVLGARLVAALRRIDPDLRFAGLGGPRLAETGMESLFPIRELALMGLLEVLPNLRRLARRLDQAAADVAARRPALLLTIDSPGFAFRLARRVRPRGVPVLHYVAPQVWAWRPGRVAEVARTVDRILALLPFEAAFFERAGLPVTFVGHPVLESGAGRGDAARFRAAHALPPDARPLLVMPGSRAGEIGRLLPIFVETVRRLSDRHPRLRPVVPVAGTLTAPLVAAIRDAPWPSPPILVEGVSDKHDAFAACAAGLIKSGTSSLELAVAGVPHVVAYRVNPLTAAIARRLIRVPHASLVNLLAGRPAGDPVVPERIQGDCTPAALAAAVLPLLEDPAAAAAQRAGFAAALARLSPPGDAPPSEAAASAVLAMLAEQARRPDAGGR